MSKEKTETKATTPIWEWVFAAIGACLVIAAVSTFLYRAASREEGPVHFSISTGAISAHDGNYAVPFRVKNLGSETAAALTIEGTLKKGEETVETSSVSIAYVPANSERQGVLIFRENPAEHELQVRPMGYEKP